MSAVTMERRRARAGSRNLLFWTGVGFIALLVVFAIVGPNMRHAYDAQDFTPQLGPNAVNWFGTDHLGRDLFARIAYGARVSLIIGFLVQVIAVTFGMFIGIISVFAPKWISIPVQRLTDGMFAFPDLLLAIMLVGIFVGKGGGLVPMVIALAVGAWPATARLVKTQVATLKDREYVVAANAMGAKTLYIVMKHILPHLWGVILAVMMVDVAATILAESTLSFLGIGVRPPMPSWGGMIMLGDSYKESNINMLIWPCLFLSMTIFALNFVGDGLRAMTDPKGNQSR
ncbi:MAG: ABC transporter permease [Armatimonadetes bacterium]|nr:ABC transporter permease [Armatimonadota bacterium]